MPATAEEISPLLPPVLRRGDTIGLVAPAGAWREEQFASGVHLLGEAGFPVKIARGLDAREGYLAGPDAHRSALFHEVWRDPEVKAVLAVRGGYGALRILADIDYRLLRAFPKPFIGFSDITALHGAITRKAGLVTFHGPMVTTLATSDPESLHAFFLALTRGIVEPISSPALTILKAGTGRGPLVGGNLTTLVHLLATPFENPWQGKIVLLEDVGEAPYRIDRLLTHLKMAGRFAGVSGLLLGSFTDCGDEEIIWARVMELFADESFPIWARLPAGHGPGNRILPFGVEAIMDSGSGVLAFAGPCCRTD
ncbi:MAG: S66 peptidase family protein [Thermodesulfobacteriota bacterium]